MARCHCAPQQPDERTALRHHIAGAAFAAAALGGNAQFELDFVKTQTRPGVAGNFSVETRRHTQTIMAAS